MTRAQSNIRLALYVFIAMGPCALAQLETINLSDPRQAATFVISVAMAGAVAWRAYIDSSETQVPKT